MNETSQDFEPKEDKRLAWRLPEMKKGIIGTETAGGVGPNFDGNGGS